LSDLHQFDPLTYAWKDLYSSVQQTVQGLFPPKRTHPGMAVARNSIFLLGGHQDDIENNGMLEA
jgi:hypothetical protein